MEISEFLADWNSSSTSILVHTSGSTGRPKEMLVEKRRMLASARITCDFLNLHPGDSALLCMPLDYIAGKMMVVRSIERSLDLHIVKPSNHPLADIDLQFDLVAMVPSQVFGSLQVAEEREKLRSIRNLIIGGGAISAEIEQQLKSFPNAVWSTYGMTETLSHIALRRINGNDASDWYTPFEGVKICIVEEEAERIGRLVIYAPHVCADHLTTNDIVELHPDDYAKGEDAVKRFRVIGRTDNVICSGGIKLHIEEIEAILRPHLSCPFCISKCRDEKFGEVAVLLTEKDKDTTKEKQQETAMMICRNVLPPYSVPKKILITDEIPLTGNGKIDRAAAQRLSTDLT